MANFVIQKKYTNNLEYITDVAKQTGLYSQSMAADPNIGFLYTNWLASKKIEGYDMQKIAELDTSYLQPTDAFFYMQNQTGDLSDEDFAKMFDSEEVFYNTFGSVENYFNVARENDYKLSVYNALNGWEKAGNTLSYLTGQFVSGIWSTVEGLIDTGATLVGAVGGIFDSGFREDVEDFIAKDTTGAGKFAQELEQLRHDYIDWDKDWTFAQIMGSVTNNIGRRVIQMIPYVGQVAYFASMAGNVMEETLQTNQESNLYLALLNGALQTGVEIVTESIFRNPAWDKFKGLVKTDNITNPVWQALATMGGEAVEEFAAEIIETPLQAAFNGEWSELTFGETLENAAMSALVGFISGGFGYGKTYLTTQNITLDDGTKLKRGQSIALNEKLANSKNFIDKYVINKTSNVEQFRINNNLSTEQLSTLNTDNPTLYAEYQKAVEADEKMTAQSLKEGLALGGMLEKLGIEKFNNAVELWNKSEADQKTVIDNMVDFIDNGSPFVSSDKELADIGKLNQSIKAEGITFVPVGKSRDIPMEYHRFRAAIKKLFGIDVVFGVYSYNNTNVLSTKQPVRNVDNTYYIDYTQAVNSSPAGLLSTVLNYKASQELSSAVSEDTHINARLQIMSALRINSNVSYEDLLNGVITNKEMAKMFFGVDKKSSFAIGRALEKIVRKATSKRERQHYANLLNTYRNAIIDSISDYDLKVEAIRRFGIVDKAHIEDLLSRATRRVKGAFAYANLDVTGKAALANQVAQELARNFENTDIDISNVNYADANNYSESFKRQIIETYREDSWLKNLNSFLYDKYGLVYSSAQKAFLQPVDLNDYVNSDAVFDVVNDMDTNRTKEEVRYLDEFLGEDFFKRYPFFEKYRKAHVRFYSDTSSTATLGGVDFVRGVISINIASDSVETTLFHEIVHLWMFAQGMQRGSPYYAIATAIAQMFAKNRNIQKYNQYISDYYGMSLAEAKALSNAEKAAYILNMIYEADYGERFAEAAETREYAFKTNALGSTGVMVDYATGTVYGTGKLQGFSLKFDPSIYTAASAVNTEQELWDNYNKAKSTGDRKTIVREFYKRGYDAIQETETNKLYLIDSASLTLSDVTDFYLSDGIGTEGLNIAKVSGSISESKTAPAKVSASEEKKSIPVEQPKNVPVSIPKTSFNPPAKNATETSKEIYNALIDTVGSDTLTTEALVKAGFSEKFITFLVYSQATLHQPPNQQRLRKLLSSNYNDLSDADIKFICNVAYDNSLDIQNKQEFEAYVNEVIPFLYWVSKLDSKLQETAVEVDNKTELFEKAHEVAQSGQLDNVASYADAKRNVNMQILDEVAKNPKRNAYTSLLNGTSYTPESASKIVKTQTTTNSREKIKELSSDKSEEFGKVVEAAASTPSLDVDTLPADMTKEKEFKDFWYNEDSGTGVIPKIIKGLGDNTYLLDVENKMYTIKLFNEIVAQLDQLKLAGLSNEELLTRLIFITQSLIKLRALRSIDDGKKFLKAIISLSKNPDVQHAIDSLINAEQSFAEDLTKPIDKKLNNLNTMIDTRRRINSKNKYITEEDANTFRGEIEDIRKSLSKVPYASVLTKILQLREKIIAAEQSDKSLVMPKETPKPVTKEVKLKNNKGKLKAKLEELHSKMSDNDPNKELVAKAIDEADTIDDDTKLERGVAVYQQAVAETSALPNSEITNKSDAKAAIVGSAIALDGESSLWVYQTDRGAYGKTTKENVADGYAIKGGGYNEIYSEDILIDFDRNDYVDTANEILTNPNIDPFLRIQALIAYIDFVQNTVIMKYGQDSDVYSQLMTLRSKALSTYGTGLKHTQVTYQRAMDEADFISFLKERFGSDYEINRDKDVITDEDAKAIEESARKTRKAKKEKYSEISKKISEARKELKTARDLDSLFNQIEKYENELEALRDDLAKAKDDDEIAKLKSKISELTALVTSLKNEITKNQELQSQLDAMREELTNALAMAEQYEKLYQAARAGDTNGMLNAMANIRAEEETPSETTKLFETTVLPKVKQKITSDTQQDIIKLDSQAKGLGDKIYGWIQTARYIGMLSAPSTWFRNYMVNGAMIGLDNVATSLAAQPWFRDFATRHIEWEVVENGVRTNLKGSMNAVHQWKVNNGKASKTALVAAEKAMFDDEEWVKRYATKESKYGTVEKFRRIDETTEEYTKRVTETKKRLQQEITEAAKKNKKNFATRAFEWYANLTNYMLTAPDVKMTMRQARKIYARLIQSNKDYLVKAITQDIINRSGVRTLDRLKRLGDGNKYKQEYNALMNGDDAYIYEHIPADIAENLKDIAGTQANRLFFRNRNKLGDLMKKLENEHKWLYFFASIPLPFGRMAMNIMNRVIEYSPAGFIKYLTDRKQINKTIKMISNGGLLLTDLSAQLETLREQRNDLDVTSMDALEVAIGELNAKDVLTKDERDKLQALTAIYENVKSIYGKGRKVGQQMDALFSTLTGYEYQGLSDTLAKATLGTVLFVLGAIMTFAGGGFLDVDEEDYFGATINFFGVKVRISDLAPVSSSFGYGILLANMIQNGFSEESITQFINGVMEDTILSFTTDAIEYSDNFGEYLLNVTSQLFTQFVPNVVRSVGRVFDQNKSQKSSNAFTRMWQNIVDAIPGIRWLFLQEKVDPYTGDAVKRYDMSAFGVAIAEIFAIISPVRWSFRTDSLAQKEAKRLETTTANPSGKFSWRGKTYKLKGDALTVYRKLRADYIEENLALLINKPGYKTATDKQKKKMIEKLYSKAGTYAKTEWVNLNGFDALAKYRVEEKA